MSVAIITGSCGLVGSAAAEYFAALGLEIIGIDNDLRADFFGVEASTAWMRRQLESNLPGYKHHSEDIRDHIAIHRIFQRIGKDIALVIHAAAQPSHDWAARNPSCDFGVNAIGTSILLEATRAWCPEAVFIFVSTNKVYGDRVNDLCFMEYGSRFDLAPDHPLYDGIPEDMPIDDSMHSLFGASKLAADILVQEYSRYFGMRTACFRCGCLTGQNHSGARLHGFLSYLVRCAVESKPYMICGYQGKQLRDNLHADDLAAAFSEFFADPDQPEGISAVYNMGGGRSLSCSILEALAVCKQVTGEDVKVAYAEERRGDHQWWISSTNKFRERYPRWKIKHNLDSIFFEIMRSNRRSELQR